LTGMLGKSRGDLSQELQRPVVHADDLVPVTP